MEYYQILQDQTITYTPAVTIPSSIRRDELRLEFQHTIPDPLIFKTKISSESKFPDILDRDFFMISESLKEVFDLFDSKIIYRVVALCDMVNIKQEIYLMPLFKPIACLSPCSVFNLDRSVLTKMVLRRKPLVGKRILRVDYGTKPIVIVRLEVAESIMRRDFRGVLLKRVLLENDVS